jgi:Tfp pilus assembly protein PilN
MRAVNLLPADQRRGGPRAGSSGNGAYAVLGVLAALVVGVGAYVTTVNSVNSSRGKLSQAGAEAASLEQQAAVFKPYHEFATLSQTRVRTVADLARSRFDWERVMRELSRALPGDVWLTSLVGTVKPGVTLEGATGSGTGSLRSSLPVPAVELVGCTESQAEVSRVMARLRTLNGVQRVSLAASEKSEAASGTASTDGGSSGDCRNGSSRYPQFQIVVFFEAPKALPGSGASPDAVATGAAPVSTGEAK